ncbi:MAG: helix-turn-helix domain-containing protein [Streptosporangiales bacterium]|nr:helix-turn-helix domain-containing protein [Streptosporangiales bacterium]
MRFGPEQAQCSTCGARTNSVNPGDPMPAHHVTPVTATNSNAPPLRTGGTGRTHVMTRPARLRWECLRLSMGVRALTEANTIGARLRALRVDRSMTQEELRDASGISLSLIRHLEQDARTSASLASLTKLAEALDCEISELVDKRDRMGGDRDGGSVLALRDVLLSPSLLPGFEDGDDGERLAVDDLSRGVRTSWEAYWEGRWGAELLARLPLMIGAARRAHTERAAGAVQPLALTYDLAS